MSATHEHWDSYYRGKDVPVLPSQFAVFVLGEISPAAVIDFGCGSGRDSFYFAHQQIPTLGIDRSTSAVALCSERSREQGLGHLQFMQSDIADPELAGRAVAKLGLDGGPILAYARFFVHAITKEDEEHLIHHASRLLKSVGGVFACEFRTIRDRSMEKATPQHYRRFIDTNDFLASARDRGLKCDYSVEGFGLAKYKHDDAHVARVMLSATR